MKQSISLLSLLFFLLIFHNYVICGAQKGLLLWYQVLIPSLLPFIIVTNALAETNSYSYLIKKMYPLFRSYTGELIIIILGNLCGYPIGGKILDHFKKNNMISKQRGDTLLPFASQASPMFIIGYIYPHILNKSCPLLIFLISIYVPTFAGYFLISAKRNRLTKETVFLGENKINITDTFYQAAKTMVLIGIYVMLFSIAYEILLPACHSNHLKCTLSFLEITTGLNVLNNTVKNSFFFLPIVGMLTTFGGLCSIFQINCVVQFKIKKYLQTKLLLSAGTFIILLVYKAFI